MGRINLDSEDLTPKQVNKAMERITANLNSLNEDTKKETLGRLVELFDDLDGDDFFGTEGWKHLFGFED